jgi:hypothetical protein
LRSNVLNDQSRLHQTPTANTVVGCGRAVVIIAIWFRVTVRLALNSASIPNRQEAGQLIEVRGMSDGLAVGGRVSTILLGDGRSGGDGR